MDLEAVGRWPSRPPWAVRSRFLLVLRFCFGLGRGVYATHFGGLRLLRLFFRITLRGEPGRPELKARRFHTPVENAIYLLGTSATRPQGSQPNVAVLNRISFVITELLELHRKRTDRR